jgi:hypothetical protein
LLLWLQHKIERKNSGAAGQPFFFAGYIYIYSQKAIIKIKSDQIKRFLRLSIAITPIKFYEKIARFLYIVQVGSQKYRTMFLNFYFDI